MFTATNILTVLAWAALTGIAAGLVLEFLAVLTGAEPTHFTRNYVSASLAGLAGAFLVGIPLYMLMDLARRSGTGEMPSDLFSPTSFQAPAIMLVCFWIMWKHLDSLQRRVVFGTMGSIFTVVVTYLLLQAFA